jgi:copper(I)-binding protein
MMRRTLVPCGLALALLALPGPFDAHAMLEFRKVPAASSEATGSARIILAQNDKMQGGDDDMADVTLGDLVIENPWARESVTKSGAAYLTVRNDGDQYDRLIGVSADVAEMAQIHESTMQDGVMKMRPVEAIEVPAHGEAVLEPGGFHIMLMGLKAPLKEGESFSLTLAFEKAGEIEVMTTIEDIAHTGGGHGHTHSN